MRQVLEACRSSSQAGARLLWESGAEKLRRTAGGVEHLERLLGNDLFSPLIRYLSVEAEPLEQIEDSARQLVTVLSGNGEPARFLFALKRQSHGDQVGQWLITGLERDW